VDALPRRARSSLRLRLLLATVAVLATALLVAAVAFERVARSVVMDAVHTHLRSRGQEVQDALARFQRERALTVASWSEAEAMQLTIDSGDGKFAEDHLRRTVQDQNGAFAAVALLSPDGEILAAVRSGPSSRKFGIGLAELRGYVVELPAVEQARAANAVRIAFAPLSALLRGGSANEVLYVAAPIKDFAGDLVGFLVGALSVNAVPALLADVMGPGSSLVPVVADREGRTLFAPTDVDADPLRPALAVEEARAGALATVDAWGRFLLPGATFFSAVQTGAMVEGGFITEDERRWLNEIDQHNPLLFDFVLKRQLRSNGKSFSRSVFETRRFFEGGVLSVK